MVQSLDARSVKPRVEGRPQNALAGAGGRKMFGLRHRALRLNGWRRISGDLQSGAGHALDGAKGALLAGVAERWHAPRARTGRGPIRCT